MPSKPDESKQPQSPQTEPNAETVPFLTIRPLDPETAEKLGTFEVSADELPLHFGRMRTHSVGGGRHLNDKEVLIDDSKPFQVSRDHCALEVREGEIVLNDKGSTLGTIVDRHILGRHNGTFIAPLSEGPHEVILGNFHSPHRFLIEVHRAS